MFCSIHAQGPSSLRPQHPGEESRKHLVTKTKSKQVAKDKAVSAGLQLRTKVGLSRGISKQVVAGLATHQDVPSTSTNGSSSGKPRVIVIGLSCPTFLYAMRTEIVEQPVHECHANHVLQASKLV